MISPEWRVVKVTPSVIDKLNRAFLLAGLPATDSDVLREVLEYVKAAFQEDWETLHLTPDGTRVYHHLGDHFPLILFYARQDSIIMYDFAIVEEVVEMFDVEVVGFEEALEDPDQPTPDR